MPVLPSSVLRKSQRASCGFGQRALSLVVESGNLQEEFKYNNLLVRMLCSLFPLGPYIPGCFIICRYACGIASVVRLSYPNRSNIKNLWVTSFSISPRVVAPIRGA